MMEKKHMNLAGKYKARIFIWVQFSTQTKKNKKMLTPFTYIIRHGEFTLRYDQWIQDVVIRSENNLSGLHHLYLGERQVFTSLMNCLNTFKSHKSRVYGNEYKLTWSLCCKKKTRNLVKKGTSSLFSTSSWNDIY